MLIAILFCYLMPVGIAALMAAMPWLSREETWFAVTVEPGFARGETGRRILFVYLVGIALLTLFVLGGLSLLLLLLDIETAVTVGYLFGALVMSVGSLLVFIYCRRRTLPFSADNAREREVEIQPELTVRDVLPGPLWVHALPYLLLLLPAAWVAWHYGRLPDMVVVGFGPEGLLHAPRSIWTVFGVTAILCFSLILIHLVMLIPLFIRRLPEQARRSRGINLILLQLMIIMGLMDGWLTLLPLYGDSWLGHDASLWIVFTATVLMLIVPVVTGFRVLPRTRQVIRQGDRSPDACWLLGMIYFNPSDPALWVEKRFGIGYTVNFARPTAWVFLGICVLVIVLSLSWTFG